MKTAQSLERPPKASLTQTVGDSPKSRPQSSLVRANRDELITNAWTDLGYEDRPERSLAEEHGLSGPATPEDLQAFLAEMRRMLDEDSTVESDKAK